MKTNHETLNMLTEEAQEKFMLLRLVKGRICQDVIIRQDDGAVEIHFEDIVLQIDALEHLFASPILLRIPWSEVAGNDE